jgi:hypothetical protein
MKPITIRNQQYYYKIDKVITDPKYTKQDIIGFITQGLKIMDRKLEIERGEII